jgi:hypothetical protein
MISFFKELYLTVFTIGFRLRMPERYGGGWGPVIDAGKGILIVSLIAFFILEGIKCNIEVFVGKRFSFDSSLWEKAGIIVLYFVNRYVLITRGHGLKFERAFTHFKKTKKIHLLVSFAVLLLVTMAFAIYSDIAYRRFFHIVSKK